MIRKLKQQILTKEEYLDIIDECIKRLMHIDIIYKKVYTKTKKVSKPSKKITSKKHASIKHKKIK